jgi:uncharacterized protein YodC (DUF2158 family)
MQINAGDIVSLKTGGPLMTVSERQESDDGAVILRCEWFFGGELCKDSFFPDELNVWQPKVA